MSQRTTYYFAIICLLVTSLLAQSTQQVFAQEGNGLFGLPSVLKGNVDILGVANHDAFRKWQLDILLNGDENQASFVAVGEKPLTEVAKLATLDTSRYPDGEHKLRLRVAYTGLQYQEFFTAITIGNGELSDSTALPQEESAADTSDIEALPDEPDSTVKVEPEKVAAPEISYDPNNYARTLEVGSGYYATEAISRSATRAEIEAAQTVDVVQLKTDVPAGPRRIEVDLSEQKLIAYQGDIPVLETQVSTGKKNGKEKLMYYTETVTGRYTIQRRYESSRMIGPGYDTANVPYVQYFFRGYAFHGAYWHNEFGTPVSHGCINMRVEEAKQLFEWADIGTEVIIYE